MTPSSVSTDVLRKLHRLQKQLGDLRQRLDHGPQQMRIRAANISRQEQTLAEAQAEAKAFRVATDSKQLQLKSKEEKVKEWRLKLNQATSNREYQALKEQIAADEMANSVLADEILEAMEKLDGMQAQIAQAQAALVKAREDAARVTQEIEQHAPLINGDIQRVEAELKTCEAELPEELRDPYHRVVRSKGDDALAPLQGEFCGGCNQQITINMINAMRMNRPIFCKACGRLLYLPE